MSDEIKITITVTEDGVACHSDKLGPAELVYWLEFAKKMVLEDSMQPQDEEAQ